MQYPEKRHISFHSSYTELQPLNSCLFKFQKMTKLAQTLDLCT